ncbi:uncharacterized protein LOC128994501 isoform X1 [Macrosteles quadrilineatus]|uniref:uncharacterized protein LOC128994501 isoform X1 n=1 Tax=Macrosteles quadrilineatus TaxID=74068 RepID=UPI0023E24D0A|nr:uncharacterized protein LOC128994501 isoform X1 [Macrosteles quadrilineatus]
MQCVVSKLCLLVWCSLVVGSDQAETESLGDKVIKKHEECEEIISGAIDDILKNPEVDPFDEFRFPAVDKYHDCKDELDDLKKDYMRTNNLEGNPKFITIKTSEGKEIALQGPTEDEDVNELDFGVVDELCVVNRKCENIMDEIEKDKEKKDKLTAKFTNCHIILERVKAAYIAEEKLDKHKLKEDGVMTVMCKGQKIGMELPSFANNLDFHTPLHEQYLKSEEESEEKEDADHHKHAEETEDASEHKKSDEGDSDHHEHADTTEEKLEPKKGKPSSAFIEKGDIISCAILVFVLAAVM